jgi:uncharacterized protein with NRDE domain
MCLIVLAYRVHPDYPIIIAANRDEFYNRPTRVLAQWADGSNIIAGQDLEGGGTWMGMTEDGRLAALTNYREPGVRMAEAPSRGHLVSDFLKGADSLNHYLSKLELIGNNYNGFNIILSEGGRWVYTSNRGGTPQELSPGIHGLSNRALNTPWPKVTRSCRAVEEHLSARKPPDMDDLMQVLQDRAVPPDKDLPRTGLELKWERRLGSIFIRSDVYGTRCSTVLLVAKDGAARICERTFDRHGPVGEVELKRQFPVDPTVACPPAATEARGR